MVKSFQDLPTSAQQSWKASQQSYKVPLRTLQCCAGQPKGAAKCKVQLGNLLKARKVLWKSGGRGCIEEELKAGLWRTEMRMVVVAPRELSGSTVKRRQPGTLLLEVVARCQFCRSIPTCRPLIGWFQPALLSHWSSQRLGLSQPLGSTMGEMCSGGSLSAARARFDWEAEIAEMNGAATLTSRPTVSEVMRNKDKVWSDADDPHLIEKHLKRGYSLALAEAFYALMRHFFMFTHPWMWQCHNSQSMSLCHYYSIHYQRNSSQRHNKAGTTCKNCCTAALEDLSDLWRCFALKGWKWAQP